jgi:hypothetical protein
MQRFGHGIQQARSECGVDWQECSVDQIGFVAVLVIGAASLLVVCCCLCAFNTRMVLISAGIQFGESACHVSRAVGRRRNELARGSEFRV